MISFEQFRIEDGSPIYLQIINYVQREIASGAIQNNDEMPSRRVLSALIGVNPNTIQKAYRYLEEEGIIESRSGAKSYVRIDDGQIKKIRTRLLENDVNAIVRNMKQMGISAEEALALIRDAWKEED
ncbi:GntR family transcriptional regulator [Emergencia timonensis]|uniref:GntR family transcriptional regulator n=1 Tax=Emergencia timonensis TaxID=1776384 RepID=UPI003996025A